MREFGVPADEFADCFKIIMEIIPVTEDVTEVIRISKDCDDESKASRKYMRLNIAERELMGHGNIWQKEDTYRRYCECCVTNSEL